MTYFDITCTRLWFTVKLSKDFHALDTQSANATKLFVSKSLNIPVPYLYEILLHQHERPFLRFLNFQYIVQLLRTMLSNILKIEGGILIESGN